MPTYCGCSKSTDGWPQVVSGALRKAAEDNVTLAQAFEHWRTRHGHLFNEFIAESLKSVAEREADLVLKLMSGSYLDDRSQLQALEEQGLFVVHTPDGYRPLRALSRSRLYDRYGRRSQPATPMQVRLFGWFLAEIDKQPDRMGPPARPANLQVRRAAAEWNGFARGGRPGLLARRRAASRCAKSAHRVFEHSQSDRSHRRLQASRVVFPRAATSFRSISTTSSST